MSKQIKKKNRLLVTAKEALWKRWRKAMGNVSTQELSQARMGFESLFAAGFANTCFRPPAALNTHERGVIDLGQCYATTMLDIYLSGETSCH